MQQQLDNLFKDAIKQRIFPGAVLGVILNDKAFIQAYGHETYDLDSIPTSNSTIYDLASITKPIPTASVVLKLIEDKKLSLDTKVIDFIPEIQAKYRKEILVKHLLTYTATFALPRLSEVANDGGQAVLDACFKAELAAKPGTTFIYNNIVCTILALICERITGKKFSDLAAELFFKPLDMDSTSFHPTSAAPSEIDWRGVVKNEAHDESAWALIKAGLTSGHAGLFSTTGDLLVFAQMLLGKGKFKGRRYLSPLTVEQMHTNQLADINEIMGLGWALKGGRFDFFGNKVSDQAFGMTGFTGTSIVIDPIKNGALVILSNSTYPKRIDDKEIINGFRRSVADVVFS